MGFTWSDFGSSEQRKRHVKPHPDRLGSEIYQTHPNRIVANLNGNGNIRKKLSDGLNKWYDNEN
ncbi:hypothetical protein SAMN05421790_101536 [Kroppenstedtia eburnea]|uniref:Uncharacterized protein n=1 Tax=Kroppenstedtia eburnea TaxID=714067 RepID=A0A1N7IYZ2_9BACL|nr:hypothetical protein SAMN05421790_101536 [Kroppenstedtia eburnea]